MNLHRRPLTYGQDRPKFRYTPTAHIVGTPGTIHGTYLSIASGVLSYLAVGPDWVRMARTPMDWTLVPRDHAYYQEGEE